MLTAWLSEDHNAKVHPKQSNPPSDLPPGYLVPHTLTQHRNSLQHKKQRAVPIKPFPHRICRQLMEQPTDGKNSEHHRCFRGVFRDPRADPMSRVPPENHEHPPKGLVPTLAPEDRQRVGGEWVVEERRPEERRLVDESDAYEGPEGVYRFDPGYEPDPGRDVDSGGDSVTLDRRQWEEYRSAEGRANLGDKLRTGAQEVDYEDILEEYPPCCLQESPSFQWSVFRGDVRTLTKVPTEPSGSKKHLASIIHGGREESGVGRPMLGCG